jgi:branched-subunit amino acid transport protein
MHDTALLCLSMLACGALSFGSRAVFLLGGKRLHLGPRLQALLAYVPPSVLAALIAPEVFVRAGHLEASAANPRLWAGLLALLVARYTRSVLASIAAGLFALWVLQAGLGLA